MSGKAYWSFMKDILSRIEEEEWDAIQKTAQLVADVTQRGDMVHIFGPGHSHTLVDEMWIRAGGLANINPVHDANMMPAFGPLKGSRLEYLEGYGTVLFETHSSKPGEVMIVVSNIGTIPVVVEVGLAAKEAGLELVTLASLDFSKSLNPVHSSGKKLYQIADLVIDNKCPPGEAALQVKGLDRRLGAASMIANAWILNAISVEASTILFRRGITPPVFTNFNIGNIKNNYSAWENLTEPYRKRLAILDFNPRK